MFTKIKFVLIALMGLLVLSACSSLNVGATSATGQPAAEGQQAAQQPDQTLSSKLLTGTLMLEDTEQAVTPQQAQDLLPLWKAVKSLSSSETASADEISALYTQIEETMTAEQVSAIKSTTLNSEDLSALMEKLGIEMPQNPMGNLTDDERATRVAQRQQGGGGGGGAFPGGGAVPGGGAMPPGGGAMPGGGEFSGRQGGAMSTTPQAGQTYRGARGGANLMLVDPLIKLLEARAAE